jgi:hypothetical protein
VSYVKGRHLFGALSATGRLPEADTAFRTACINRAKPAPSRWLDMEKCCSNFQSPDDLPLKAIGNGSAISNEKWMEIYEQSRFMHFVNQAEWKAFRVTSANVFPRVPSTAKRWVGCKCVQDVQNLCNKSVTKPIFA